MTEQTNRGCPRSEEMCEQLPMLIAPSNGDDSDVRNPSIIVLLSPSTSGSRCGVDNNEVIAKRQTDSA